MMEKTSRLLKLILPDRITTLFVNRYFLATLVLAAYMGVIDENSLFKHWQMNQELEELRAEKAYYQKQIINTRATYENLFSNPDKLEKFAREKYLMKRPKEDIFIIEYKD